MKLGVFTVLFADKPLEEVLAYLRPLGVGAVELGAGGFPNPSHLKPDELLKDDSKVKELKELISKYDMTISALSCHGNPVHPNEEVAAEYRAIFERTVLVAEKLGVDTINGFSGCPGDGRGGTRPNWVTCAWPPEFIEISDYQWNEALIPYWEKAVKFANEHGVTKIALEMHPGFTVYNPSALLRLRNAVGDTIGANFDPSHLFWQGIDPVEAIKALKGAIYHFHAKDTNINKANTAVNGVLDTGSYTNLLGRSWLFRTVGYGNGAAVWKDMISMLRAIGYDGAISIEHEDALMTSSEGLEKAIAFLRDILMYKGLPHVWWA